ncbi:transcription factor GAGA isoform X6 [Eurytemora carolleeae]|uniref:transcription factor GAGA isoform X6 n=1 Tax=Eurytemora carolleeae TaxID=1294199 RepID=UPI000C757CA1|nr:transcription factor GAGA isoform X6 [Eurytemora carolleeae]|eukprot:XP_023331615.1 transcription factor GAGA-like isoform X6 [Eurytemora affinis]
MATEKFCLKWNDFESNISVAFRDLRDEKEFFDITLACEDNQIQAHKVILSACSPFFRNMLKVNPHQHPLIYLRGMKFADLESVLNFMYYGEVNVAQDELNSFLAVAEDLRVKGLTQNKNGESVPDPKPRTPPVKTHIPDRDPPPPAKRPRPTPQAALPPPSNPDDDIQEVVPVKSEPKDSVPILPSPSGYHSQALVQQDEYDERYDEYDQDGYDDQYLGEGLHQDTEKGSEEGNGEERKGCPDRKLLLNYLQRTNVGFSCTICGKQNSQRGNSMNHVESVHFPNLFEYECYVCGKKANNYNSLQVHISTNHRNLKK